MDLFDAVKNSVTTRDAAESYGVSVNHAGMVCCIFHDDHTPSMKVDERFHCFGCGADGDVIDYCVLCSYRHLLIDWKQRYAPNRDDEDLHPLYMEALRNLDRVDYLLDELQGCTAEEAKGIIASSKNEIGPLCGQGPGVHATATQKGKRGCPIVWRTHTQCPPKKFSNFFVVGLTYGCLKL